MESQPQNPEFRNNPENIYSADVKSRELFQDKNKLSR